MISSPAGVMTVLVGTAAFYFWLERFTRWRIFRYLVPLIWIYATPMVLRNLGLLPGSSRAYDLLRQYGLPMFIVLLLLSVDVGAAVRVMGRGILVMLLGTAGIVLGAPVGYWVVKSQLAPDAWKGFGALAGSWIGGTGNMAAVAGGLDLTEGSPMLGLAILADTVIYVGWLPLLLFSKSFADRFNRWTGVSDARLERMEAAAAKEEEETERRRPEMVHFLYLGLVAIAVTWVAKALAPAVHAVQLQVLPASLREVFSEGTWEVLLVTTMGISLSFTRLKRVPFVPQPGDGAGLCLRRPHGGERVALGPVAGPVVPARGDDLDLDPRCLLSVRCVAVQGRRAQRGDRLGGERRRGGLGAGGGGVPPGEPGAGVDLDGVAGVCAGELSRRRGGAALRVGGLRAGTLFVVAGVARRRPSVGTASSFLDF